MPQDPLQSLLVNRQILGAGPDSGQALPETLSPGQEAAQSSSPLSSLRGPIQGGVDTLLSTLGIRGVQPGHVGTLIGGMANAAMSGPGKLPFGALHGAEEAGSAASPLLREIFAKNPAAEATYAKAMESQLPKVLADRQAASAARYATQAKAHDALLDLDVAGRPRPIPTDTGFATAIPTGPTTQRSSLSVPLPSTPIPDRPPLLGSTQGGAMNGPTLDRLAKSGLSEDDIRSMRKLTMDQLKAKYPNMNPSTLRGIMTGETYSHIKD